MTRDVKNYEVFKLAHEMVLKVYSVTKKFPDEEKFGLVSQMRRSAYSIPMNLVEGSIRESESEFRYFVNICRGSCAEIQYQIDLVRDLGYISLEEHDDLQSRFVSIGKMLTKLMQTLKAKS